MDTLSQLPEKIGKYEVVGMIGRGGMGVVYKARDPVIDRIVAIKTIRLGDTDIEDDQLSRLRMEARSAGRLHHPNIVTVFDYGEEGDFSYIVMEYVEGVNLGRVMQKQRPLSLSTRIDVLMQIARGLSYAHECGVVHRDMKPSNVCVTRRGVAKILDFGLARFDNTRLTKTGFLSGTIAYMSPERFGGETGLADDIFALGAVAYELLTYRRAFPGETTPEIISKILSGVLPPPVSEVGNLPVELDDIVFRALQRDPLERYRSAADFEQALRDFTLTPAFQRVAAEQAKAPELSTANWSDETREVSGSAYSSGRSIDGVPIDAGPTMQLAEQAPPTEVTAPPRADPTLLTTAPGSKRRSTLTSTATAVMPEAPPTEIVAAPARRRPVVPLALGGVLLAAIVAIAIWVSFPEPSPSPPVDHQASRESQVQVATASTLATLLAQRQLSPDDQARFTQANSRLLLARQKIEEKDYAAAAALATEASTTFRELLSQQASVPPATETTVTARTETAPRERPIQIARQTPQRPTRTEPVRTETAAPPPPPPQPQHSAAPVPQPPAPEPRRPQPSQADLEREIRSFVQQMARAYENKDVGFFRENSARFSEEMAAAIRNSPSVKVEIAVNSIRLVDDTSAVVNVRRTDRFAEASVPPGVQNLVYELRRANGKWEIVRLSRL